MCNVRVCVCKDRTVVGSVALLCRAEAGRYQPYKQPPAPCWVFHSPSGQASITYSRASGSRIWLAWMAVQVHRWMFCAEPTILVATYYPIIYSSFFSPSPPATSIQNGDVQLTAIGIL